MVCDCVVLRDHSFLSFFLACLSFSPSLYVLWFCFFFSTMLQSILSQALAVYSFHVYMNMNVYFYVFIFYSHLSLNLYLVELSCRPVLRLLTLLLVHKHLCRDFCTVYLFSIRPTIAIGSIKNILFHKQWPLRIHFNSTLLLLIMYISVSICPFVLHLLEFHCSLHFIHFWWQWTCDVDIFAIQF